MPHFTVTLGDSENFGNYFVIRNKPLLLLGGGREEQREEERMLFCSITLMQSPSMNKLP